MHGIYLYGSMHTVHIDNTPPYLFKKSHGFGQGPKFLTKRPSVGQKPESKKLADRVFRDESNGMYETTLRVEF